MNKAYERYLERLMSSYAKGASTEDGMQVAWAFTTLRDYAKAHSKDIEEPDLFDYARAEGTYIGYAADAEMLRGERPEESEALEAAGVDLDGVVDDAMDTLNDYLCESFSSDYLGDALDKAIDDAFADNELDKWELLGYESAHKEGPCTPTVGEIVSSAGAAVAHGGDRTPQAGPQSQARGQVRRQ